MNSAPTITITRLDLQRLERLLDSLDEFDPAQKRCRPSWIVPKWWGTTKCRPVW